MDHHTNHEMEFGCDAPPPGEHCCDFTSYGEVHDCKEREERRLRLLGKSLDAPFAQVSLQGEVPHREPDPDGGRMPAKACGVFGSRYKLTIYEKYYQFYRNVMDSRGGPMETWVYDNKYDGWWVRCQWHPYRALGFKDVWLWVCNERAKLTGTEMGHDYYDMADVLESIFPYLRYENLTADMDWGFVDLGVTMKPMTEDWHWDNEHHGWWVECWWKEFDHSEWIWVDPISEYI